MGRGRAKAKQTKVARQLKYNSGATDLDRLRAELSGAASTPSPGRNGAAPEVDAEAEVDDDYPVDVDDEDTDQDATG